MNLSLLPDVRDQRDEDSSSPSMSQFVHQVMAVSEVRPGLFLSGLDSALKLSVLTSRNILLIVNASGLEDVPYPEREGMGVQHVRIQDRPHEPLSRYFEPVAQLIHLNRTGGTLVHCSAGRSRSPTLIMAYLMRFEGLNLRRAHELVLHQRPSIRPNGGFWRQLMDYERKLFGKNTVRMTRTPSGVLPEALEDSGLQPEYCINV
ncbi:dual specificity protein phosphatase 14 isoform 1-T1 [Spinachia spinachia]